MEKQKLDNVVFVGEVDAGKSALVDKLVNIETNTGKTQSPIFYPGKVIDTPGEFIDKRSLSGALLTTICNVKSVVLLQPASGKRFAPPNGLLNVYPNKNIIGVISKVDEVDADIEHAKKLFRQNRIPEPYFEVSIFDQDSIDKLSHYLLSLQ
jgi:ethanolamine utilization protein EutP